MAEEEIFGIDVSRIDADRLAAYWIKAEWREIERALVTGKWFEYRFLNPTAATYVFAHEYTKAYRRTYQRNIDTERGEHVTPYQPDLFRPKNETPAIKAKIASIWRARQVADAMGMPYDVFLERAFHWATRYWRQKHIPQARNLVSDLVTDRVPIDWEEYQLARLYYSKLPQYTTQLHDSQVQALNDHHEHLFRLIGSRGNSSTLITQLIEEDVLPALKVHERLGPDVFAEAVFADALALTATI